jgi:phage terminase large subunit
MTRTLFSPNARPESVEHAYEPRGAALAAFEERSDELLLAGPAGTGKSRACLEKLHLLALLNPGMRGLMVRKTLVSLKASGLVTWRDKVTKEGQKYNVVRYHGDSGQEPAQYSYGNGSVIVVGGMDKATKIMSTEYDVIYVQEATELTEDDWEMLTSRLRNGRVSFQQLIADCNPAQPTHWLKARADKGLLTMLESRHEDNPVLCNADGTRTAAGISYLEKLDRLTGVRRDRLYRGVWAAADGLIYDEFDPAIHLIDQFEIPQEWDRYWAIDFGYTNPFVCQFWAQDPDGRLYLYREVYMTGRTVDQHAEKIAKLVMRQPTKKEGDCWRGAWREPRPRAVICDHDAEGRVVFERAIGVSTKSAEKKVHEGIQAVQRRLRKAGDGKPRIFILRDALAEKDKVLDERKAPTCTEQEVTGYIWGQSTSDQLKEAPVKKDDHGMDAMRYLVMDRDLGRRPRYHSFTV